MKKIRDMGYINEKIWKNIANLLRMICACFSFFLIISIVNAQTTQKENNIVPVLSLLLFDDPEFYIESAQVSEGDTSSKTARLAVRLSSPLISSSSIDFIYPQGGTATEGADYTRPSAGTVMFAAGETLANIEFQILSDQISEPNEFFTVELINPVGAKLSARDIGVMTIIDEDGMFNDTGIDFAAEATILHNFQNCTSQTTPQAQQDCANGRDALAAAGLLTKLGSGPNGFDYTKLTTDGAPLSIQTSSYSSSGNETAGTKWACVRDNHTGLIWEVKEVSGVHAATNTYRWGGLTATGINHLERQGNYYSDWNVLVNSANNNLRCGQSDWRVPDIKSLQTILHHARRDEDGDFARPATSLHFFPFTDSTFPLYWTSSPYNFSDFDAFIVDFREGFDSDKRRDSQHLVRLVSGARLETIGHATAIAVGDEQHVHSYMDNTTPDSRYTVSGDGATVLDTLTGLMWQRCSAGQSGGNCSGTATQSNWADAVLAAQSSTVGGYDDWRLPNIQELLSLQAFDRRSPAINSTIFPSMPTLRWVWSSTPSHFSGNFIKLIKGSGTTESSKNTTSHIARFVRGGGGGG